MSVRRTAAACLLVALAASCTHAKRPVNVTPGPAPAGTVRFGYETEPPTLDPLSGSANIATRDILRPMLPALFALDAKLHPQPELAAGWPSRGDFAFDPFTVTIRLRAAAWSDGTPITASDVRFSYDKLRAGPTGARYRFLKDVVVVSSRRLKLRFDRPVRRWWALFSIDDMVLPAHAYSEAWERAPTVSGGPFMFDGWTPGLDIRLKRNDTYWGTKASVGAIDVVFVPDEETRLVLFSKGELDLMSAEGEGDIGARARSRGAPPSDGALTGKAGASGAWGPGWWELDLDATKVPGPVAEAVGRALDRSLVAELFDDSGQRMDGIPARFPVAGAQADALPGVPGPWPPSGDVDAAKAALQKAGYKRIGPKLADARGAQVQILLAFAEGPSGPDGIARLIHFRLKELGIHVEITGVDPTQLAAEWLPHAKADAYLVLRRGSDAPDAASYRSDAPPARNPARVRSVDDTIDQSETAPDTAHPESAVTGLNPGAWGRAEAALVASHDVYPLVRIRSWIVGRGIAGPQATGSQAGPLWDAAAWHRV